MPRSSFVKPLPERTAVGRGGGGVGSLVLYNNIPRGFGNFFLKQLQMLFYVFVPNERTTITLFLCWVSGNVPLEKNLKLRSSEMSFPAF